MKTRCWVSQLALGGLLLKTQAQLFGPESFTGAVLGGTLGGIVGHQHGRHTGEGIAIGAGLGLLLGAAHAESRRPSLPTQYPAVSVPVGWTYPSPMETPVSLEPASGGEPMAPPPSLVRPAPSLTSNPAMAGANALFGR